MIAFCEAILADVGREATIIPGHGEVTNGAGMAEAVEMLKSVRARVAAAIRAGRSLPEIIASKPTAEFDARFKRQSNPDEFIDRVYASLNR